MPTAAETTKPAKPAKAGKKPLTPEQSARAWRETIESIVIAIILAFLFRTFEAEAFVIPTGSMAPTLQGRHRDVECPQCSFRYRSGASEEEREYRHSDEVPEVVATVCPICRYTHVLNKADNPNEDSFTGDRILVSKFAYQIGEPERWDPIVFKFPGNPKINYIKRLVALPHEEGRIFHGDVYAKSPGQSEDRILRKPPHKLVAMLQLVDDTNYVASKLLEVKWPSRWQQWYASGTDTPAKWSFASPDMRGFTTDGQGGESWIRYRHLAPFESDWSFIREGQLPPDLRDGAPDRRKGILITDFYAYNVNYSIYRSDYLGMTRAPLDEFEQFVRAAVESERAEIAGTPHQQNAKPLMLGRHWVGDLAIEAEVDVSGTTGEVLLDLVEGGRHHTCRIDVATGVAKLEIDGGKVPFVDDKGKETASTEATTTLQGTGKYHLRLSNCDDEVLLWINGRVVNFNVPTTYATRSDCEPKYLDNDPLDLAPAGIGTNGATFSVSSLRVLRDIYYIASSNNMIDYNGPHNLEEATELFRTPTMWDKTAAFSSRRSYAFKLEADEFFPLGDNSPESADARSWQTQPAALNIDAPFTPPHVRRELLIGKALVIYWPHAWNRPVPFTPNIERMGIIR